ncbi:MAG: hypothetical protein ICCCNLDF_02530 [Planctomycetes bacterium]|nr:hypothetical protein [Planctomycetota bacterium]
MPIARFWCWLRSLRQLTTIPVGTCVMRTALSTLFTFWPPLPPARLKFSSRSFSLISMSISSDSASGTTSTLANAVCRLPAALNGEIRTSRWVPTSPRRKPAAKGPLINAAALRMPATSSSW